MGVSSSKLQVVNKKKSEIKVEWQYSKEVKPALKKLMMYLLMPQREGK